MASPVPAKSQPLHNFDLPRTLKWNKDPSNPTHRRRSVKSPVSSTRSPTRSDSAPIKNHSKIQSFVKGSKSDKAKNKDLGESKKSSKILIKINKNNNTSVNANDDVTVNVNVNDVVVGDKVKIEEEKESCEFVKKEGFDDEFVDEEAKTWNLRPRKPIRKSLNVNGSGIGVKNVVEKSQVDSPVKNAIKVGENEEKVEKLRHCLDVCLTKEEIEEDIYAFTGLKPSRRPKKRAKLVQKQVDFVFPGLWLMSITPDSYKVSENSMKG